MRSWLRLERIYEYSRRRSGRGIILSREGRELGVAFHNGSSPAEAVSVRSCSKSFTAALIAKMVDMGLLTFDTLACTIITEWASDPLKNKIKIIDLLQQRSGMQAIAFQQLSYGQVIALPATAQAWDYDNSHWLVLAEIIRRIVTAAPHNKISPSHALKDWVLDPAGIVIESWDHLNGAISQPNMASGANITLHNMAKFGELLRSGGNGIISTQQLQVLTTPSAYSAYCAGFWKTKDRIANITTGNADPRKALPGDDFCALGLRWSFIYVLFSSCLVFARTGGAAQAGDPPFIEEEILSLVAGV